MEPEYLELDTLIYVRNRKGVWKPRYVALRIPNNREFTVTVFTRGCTSKSARDEDAIRHYHRWLLEEEFLSIRKKINKEYAKILCGATF